MKTIWSPVCIRQEPNETVSQLGTLSLGQTHRPEIVIHMTWKLYTIHEQGRLYWLPKDNEEHVVYASLTLLPILKYKFYYETL